MTFLGKSLNIKPTRVLRAPRTRATYEHLDLGPRCPTDQAIQHTHGGNPWPGASAFRNRPPSTLGSSSSAMTRASSRVRCRSMAPHTAGGSDQSRRWRPRHRRSDRRDCRRVAVGPQRATAHLLASCSSSARQHVRAERSSAKIVLFRAHLAVGAHVEDADLPSPSRHPRACAVPRGARPPMIVFGQPSPTDERGASHAHGGPRVLVSADLSNAHARQWY